MAERVYFGEASERARRVSVCLTALAVAFIVALLMQKPAHAGESFTWTGEGNGSSWTDSCNWWPKDSSRRNIRARMLPMTRPRSKVLTGDRPLSRSART
jgi:hypothetical protein